MKIYVNGDSFTAGDGLADPETFGDIYPGHHTMGEALDREWDKMHEYYVKIYPNLIAQLEKEASITEKTNGA